jgi:hypothetical protein
MAKWEEIRDDLFEAIIQVQPTINKEQQADIVNVMRARGHDTSWNAIRYVYYASQKWDENLAANISHHEQVLGVAAWLGLFPFLPLSTSFFAPCLQLPICLTFRLHPSFFASCDSSPPHLCFATRNSTETSTQNTTSSTGTLSRWAAPCRTGTRRRTRTFWLL